MNCQRAHEIDVETFLIDAGVPELEDFRAHYPFCADCSAAVSRWTRVERGLADLENSGAAGHPTPERFEVFLSARESLGEEASRIEQHLADCPTCRTEFGLMQRFDPGQLMAASETAERLPAVQSGSVLAAVQRFLGSLFAEPIGLATAIPALAIALIALSLWWSGVFERAGVPAEVDTSPQFVQEISQPELPDPGAVERSPAPEVPPPDDLIASAPTPPAPRPETSPAPTPPPSKKPALSPPPAADAPTEEILVAALTAMPSPHYLAPLEQESLAWMRRSVRAGPADVSVEVRAPRDHTGLTLSESPRLWWQLRGGTELGLQFTLIGEEAIEPLLRLDLPGPHTAGLQDIKLSEHGIRLEDGHKYRWFVSIQLDPERPSRNPVSAGALQVIPASDPRRAKASQATPSQRGHTLAELGLWYDAYDFFASLALAHAESGKIAEHRDHLANVADGADP